MCIVIMVSTVLLFIDLPNNSVYFFEYVIVCREFKMPKISNNSRVTLYIIDCGEIYFILIELFYYVNCTKKELVLIGDLLSYNT